MSQEPSVDELFGEGSGTPTPRTHLVVGLLSGGLLLALLGMVCTTVPGGLIVLWAWSVIERESDRIESGYLPADSKRTVVALQRAVLAGLVVVLVLFTLQAWLLGQGFYEQLWPWMIRAAAQALGATPPPAP